MEKESITTVWIALIGAGIAIILVSLFTSIFGESISIKFYVGLIVGVVVTKYILAELNKNTIKIDERSKFHPKNFNENEIHSNTFLRMKKI